MSITKLFTNLREWAIATENLDFAEEVVLFDLLRELRKKELSFDSSGSQIKAILESVYTDGISGLEGVQVEEDKITGFFLDRISASLTKRYSFTIAPDKISYTPTNAAEIAATDFTVAEFATATKKKNCVKGFACGNTCLPLKTKCGKDTRCTKTPKPEDKKEIEAIIDKGKGKKTPVSKKSKTTVKPTLPKPLIDDKIINIPTNTSDHKQLIAYGDSFTSKYIKPVDKSEEDELKKIISEKLAHEVRISDAYDNRQAIEIDGKIRKVKIADLNASREAYHAAYDNFNDAQRRREALEIAQHDEIRKAVIAHHKMSDFEIKEFTNMTEINFNDYKLVANVQAYHKDFVALTGGKGHESLTYFEEAGGRAHASLYNQSVNIGDGTKESVFHEIGHHVEYNNPNFNEAAIAFRTERAVSQIPEKLSKITGSKNFEDDEVALRGKYSSPYIGKIYDTNPFYENYTGRKGFAPTEVISMGFEKFDSPKSMSKFYAEDKEHYNMIIAMMLAK